MPNHTPHLPGHQFPLGGGNPDPFAPRQNPTDPALPIGRIHNAGTEPFAQQLGAHLAGGGQLPPGMSPDQLAMMGIITGGFQPNFQGIPREQQAQWEAAALANPHTGPGPARDYMAEFGLSSGNQIAGVAPISGVGQGAASVAPQPTGPQGSPQPQPAPPQVAQGTIPPGLSPTPPPPQTLPTPGPGGGLTTQNPPGPPFPSFPPPQPPQPQPPQPMPMPMPQPGMPPGMMPSLFPGQTGPPRMMPPGMGQGPATLPALPGRQPGGRPGAPGQAGPRPDLRHVLQRYGFTS